MAGFEFKYSSDWYSVQGAEALFNQSPKAMRAEYTRMRDAAQKRLSRLGKAFPDSKAYQAHAQGFKKLKDIDPRDLSKAFADLAKFMKARGSTVSGQREIKRKTIQTFQEQGLDLTPKNYDATIKVLEEMRKRKLIYGSDKAVALGSVLSKLSTRQANTWLSHLPELLPHADKLQEIPKTRGMSFKQVLKMLGD